MNSEEERQWRESLKPGDEVVISRGSWGRRFNKGIVTRITKASVFVDTIQFWKKNGNRAGGGAWDTTYLHPLTEDIKQEMREEELKRQAVELRGKLAIPQDEKTLVKFIAALKEFVK